jgi:hypothetical protein
MYRHVLNNASIVTPSFTAPSKNSNYCYSHIIEQAKRIDYDDFVIIRPRRIPIAQSARTVCIYEMLCLIDRLPRWNPSNFALVCKEVKEEIMVIFEDLYTLHWMKFIPFGMCCRRISYALNPFAGNAYMGILLKLSKRR